MRKHNLTLFVECLATEIVETYKHLAGISEEQGKTIFTEKIETK